MTPLEVSMIEVIKLVGISERTQDTYLFAVRKISKHFQKSPDLFNTGMESGRLRSRPYMLYPRFTFGISSTPVSVLNSLLRKLQFDQLQQNKLIHKESGKPRTFLQ